MVLIVAVLLFVSAVLLWRSTIHGLARPNPPRWVSDDACLILIAPAITTLLAFSVSGFVKQGFTYPISTLVVFIGLIVSTVLFAYFMREKPNGAIHEAAVAFPEERDLLHVSLPPTKSDTTRTAAVNDPAQSNFHAA